MEESINGERRGWHMGREISLPGVAALFIQTIAVVWWLAGLSYTVNQARSDVVRLEAKIIAVEIKVDALTDSMKVPAALNAAKITVLEAQVLAMEQRVRDVLTELHAVRAEQLRRTPFIPQKPQSR